MADPVGRFSIAFGQPSLNYDLDWTRIDSYPNLVTSYTIDRGRQFELDRTDTGRATVEITDPDGILDPTNTGGPLYGGIVPILPAAICRWDPVTASWWTRFRGFIEEYQYVFDPSQLVNKLTVSLVDLFEILANIEMQPNQFGFTPPTQDQVGQIYFENAAMDDRILLTLQQSISAASAADFGVIFTGNVELHSTVYSAGESPLTVIQDAADAEIPCVSNVYCDRLGRICVHGRLAKIDPVGTAASTDGARWDFQQWKAGDKTAVSASPSDTAQLRRFAYSMGLSKMINHATATPIGIADGNVEGQIVENDTSITTYGFRSWSAQNLLTKHGYLTGHSDLNETKAFAQYFVANYAQPRPNRITDIAFRSMHPGWEGAAATWKLLSRVDIADLIAVTVGSPGGGGFDHESHFVEGVHEEAHPLNPDYDDVTVTLDLSPQAYFDNTSMLAP